MCDGCDDGILRAAGLRGSHVAQAGHRGRGRTGGLPGAWSWHTRAGLYNRRADRLERPWNIGPPESPSLYAKCAHFHANLHDVSRCTCKYDVANFLIYLGEVVQATLHFVTH
jgi:hypothetical protein